MTIPYPTPRRPGQVSIRNSKSRRCPSAHPADQHSTAVRGHARVKALGVIQVLRLVRTYFAGAKIKRTKLY